MYGGDSNREDLADHEAGLIRDLFRRLQVRHVAIFAVSVLPSRAALRTNQIEYASALDCCSLNGNGSPVPGGALQVRRA